MDLIRPSLREDKNERDFKDPSLSIGTAVLAESMPDGSNEPVPILGAQMLIDRFSSNNSGFGLFGAVNVDAPTKGIDYIGLGALFSIRVDGTAYPFNFGIGYMIDRNGFANEQTMSRGDRTGVFIMLSTNPATPPVKAWESLFKPK